MSEIQTPDPIQNITMRQSKNNISWIPEINIKGWDLNDFRSRANGWKTIEKMQRDDQVFAVSEVKKLFLLSSGWEVSGENEDIKQFIQDNLDNTKYYTFNKVLYNILSAIDYGFSVSEIIYKIEQSKIMLDRIMTIHPQSIDFVLNEDDTTTIIQRCGSDIYLNDQRCLVYTRNSSFLNPYGKSDFEKAYKSWFLKDFTQKCWGIFQERYASPFPIAKVPEGFDETKSLRLLKILESMRTSGAAVIPDSVVLEYLEATGSKGSDYSACLDKMNQGIARSLLIPDLIGFGSGANSGSYALGTEQFNLFYNIMEFDRLLITDLINDKIIKPLILFNFGEKYINDVKFCFKQINKDSKFQIMDYFFKMVEKNMPVTLDDINKLRGGLGLSVLDDSYKEKVEGSDDESSNIPNNSNDDDTGVSNESEDKVEEKEESKEEESKEEKEEFIKKDSYEVSYKFNRKVTKYEARVDFVSEFKIMDNKITDIRKELASLFDAQKNRLKKDIAKKRIIDQKKYDQVQKIQLSYLGDIKETLNDSLTDIYLDSRAFAENQITKLPQKKNNAKTDDLTTIGVISDKSIEIAKKYIDNNTFQAIGKIKDDISNKVKQKLIQGIAKGKSTADIMKEIDEIYNPYVDYSYVPDQAETAFLLETIIRTNTTDLYNTAKLQVSREPINDNIVMLQYSAILDDRTTEICEELDGFIAPKDSPEWDNITPPNHYNCRSQLLYITDVDVELDGVKASDPINVGDLQEFPETKGFM